MRTILTFLACLTFVPLATGCGLSGEYCDARNECERLSEREYDQCIIDQDALEDTADAYGCGDLYAIAHDCTMVNNNCVSVGNVEIFGPEAECADEIGDWIDCIKGQSSLD